MGLAPVPNKCNQMLLVTQESRALPAPPNTVRGLRKWKERFSSPEGL